MKILKIILVLFGLFGLFSEAFAQDDIKVNEIKVLKGHTKPIFSVAFSPDGNRLVSGSYDKSVKIWDVNAGRLLQTLGGHTDAVYSVVYNSPGNILATCGKDRTIRIWDAKTGRRIRTLLSDGEVTSIAFDPIRNQIASAGEKGVITIWDIDSGKKKFVLRGHKDWISSLDYSFDGAYLASSSYDKQILLWIPSAGRQLTYLPQSNASVNAISFQPNGTTLIAGSSDKTVMLWEIPTGELIKTFEPGTGEIISVSFNDDGDFLACAMSDGTIGIWEVETGKIMTNFESEHNAVNSVVFSPDGRLLASAGEDKNIRLWQFGGKPNLPPVIAINSPIDAVTENKTISLIAKVFDDREIKKIIVSHNNLTIIDESIDETGESLREIGITIVPTNQITGDYKEEINIDRFIELIEGENIFEITAFDGELTSTKQDTIIFEIPNQPPVIVINSPVDTVTENQTVFLSARILDDRGIKNIVVKHNNQSLIDESIDEVEETSQLKGFAVVPTIEISGDYKSEININRSVELMQGENTFEIIAFDGELTSIERTIITYEIPFWMQVQRWAVIIGISDYKYPGIPDLRYADRDATEFYKFLKSPQGGGFAENRIKFLINENATTQNIRDALFVFLRQAIEEDLVYIYFSGHGIPEPDNPDNLYLATYDTDPERLASTAFPMWDIETALARHIPAEKVVLLADACHSGGISGGIGTRNIAQQNLINKYLIELMKAKPGKVIFTASEVGEVSQESQKWGGGHGVFTYFFLEGLKGAADTNKDGIVTLGEAIDYTDEHVRRATNARQHPDTAGQFDRSLPMSVIK